MSQNINHYTLHVVLVSIILCGVQGHPHERSYQPTNRHADSSSPNVQTKIGYNVTSNVVEQNRSIDSDGKIIFPSSGHTAEPQRIHLRPVAACENATFCEYASSYPKDFIKTAIKGREDLKYLSIVDTFPEIGQRVGSGNDESLCAYQDTVVFPQSGKNKDKQWLHIVNEDNFPQGVRIETCDPLSRTERTACRIIEGSSPLGYETFCKQKFVYRQLAAVTPEGIGADFFSFPASCCCHIKFTGHPASRLGIDLDKSQPQSPAPRIAV